MPLEIFGFLALWSPFFAIAVVFATVLYFLITVKWRSEFKESEPLSIKQAIFFILSMVLLYVIKGSPVDLLGHIMFSVHMIQMATLYLVIPPLMIIGIPKWVWKAFINLKPITNVFTLLTRPLLALILFNSFFSFYHIPLIFDAVKLDETLHGIYTVGLFIFAILMWWPMINKLELNELSGLKKVGYIFASGVLLTPACGLIIFANGPLYATYYDQSTWMQALALCVPTGTLDGLSLAGPEIFTNMQLIEDQKLGGVLMKIIQEIVYGFLLGIVFFEWYKKDQEEANNLQHTLLVEE
ncbi:cytochrome c oxidase assembly factor CtaG [Bacillus coahuilensis]|uniref:cytochrome c oxidase assembly factor CtaG n=1 Tax=Bacillus coahuilensis TaxID=408580 RepID=UPI00031B1E89|nr:cytochrome c oxidase assembly factor CtaG [Bacillus coahuilensis]